MCCVAANWLELNIFPEISNLDFNMEVGTRVLASAGKETLLHFSSGNSYQGGLHEGREPGGRSVKLNRVVKQFLMSAGRFNPWDSSSDSKLALVGQGFTSNP